ncbi:actin interacting protein 3-domain-containing protein [Absidia repens]|uniref:Actin interacting protein 3-domain-containing protein n=1 Tax=Absidia repens TaxID=90262 RepID=A0A1X2IS32_9FUNG|nr:actin interacting protein 3-domain-containing protein [Absidia repens]
MMSANHLSQKEEYEKIIIEIDQSVTGLLKCTKDLLAAITNWSIQSSHKENIYEQYDSLQYHFDKVCHAFHAANLPMDDLIYIPMIYNNPSLLEHHLPSIRDTILQLLQGLKRKQALLHEKSPTARSPAMDTATATINQNQKNAMVTSTSTSSELDMMDPNTQHAVTQLRDDGDLAARSSIRRSSTMEPVNGTDHSLSLATANLTAIDSASTATVIQPPARRRRGLLASPSQPDLAKPGAPSPPPRRISTTTPSSPTGIAHCRKKSNVVDPSTKHATVLENTEMPLVLFLQWKNRTKRVVVDEPLNSLHQVMDLFRCTFKNAFDHTTNNTSNSDTMKISLLDNDTNIMYELDDITSIRSSSLLSLDDPVTNGMELKEIVQQAFKTQFDQWTSLISITPNNGPGAAITVDTSLNDGLDSSMPIGDEASHGDKSDNTVSTLTQSQSQQQSLVDQIRDNFSMLQKSIKEHQQNNEWLMTQLADYQQQQQEQQQEQQQQKDKGNYNLQKSLQDMGHALTTRLETLQDTIDDMKQDVTQRRCRPSPSQLDDCHKESNAVKGMIQSVGEYISQSKSTWKKSWEEQLQRIVSEQQCVKEYEHLVLDFEEDHSAILTVLQHLTQVSELQKRQPIGSNPVMVDIGGGDGDDDQGHGGGREGMGYVLQQLQTIDVDHQKRLDALAQAEKRRARDMANRIDDFEKELITFVDTNKLKKTGGPEQLERQQQEKTKQLLMDLYEKNKAT